MRLRLARRAAVTLTLTSLALVGLAPGVSAAPGFASQQVEPPAADLPAEPAQPLVTFGISPAGPGAPDDRPFLSYGLPPGAQVFDNVTVLNQSNIPLTLLVYGGDALNSAGGGLDITRRSEPNDDLGSWLTVGEAAAGGPVDPSGRSLVEVTVPPQNSTTGRGAVIVPVRISVPVDATPGARR